jgi:hypothetical protein
MYWTPRRWQSALRLFGTAGNELQCATFAGGDDGFCRRSGSNVHEPVVVGVDDGVYAIAAPSFIKTRATWVLTVVSETKNAFAISALDSPWATRSRVSRSRGVKVARRCAATASMTGRRARKVSIMRRVILGASRDSPAWTALMPATSSSGSTSLTRNPLGPPHKASYT